MFGLQENTVIQISSVPSSVSSRTFKRLVSLVLAAAITIQFGCSSPKLVDDPNVPGKFKTEDGYVWRQTAKGVAIGALIGGAIAAIIVSNSDNDLNDTQKAAIIAGVAALAGTVGGAIANDRADDIKQRVDELGSLNAVLVQEQQQLRDVSSKLSAERSQLAKDIEGADQIIAMLESSSKASASMTAVQREELRTKVDVLAKEYNERKSELELLEKNANTAIYDAAAVAATRDIEVQAAFRSKYPESQRDSLPKQLDPSLDALNAEIQETRSQIYQLREQQSQMEQKIKQAQRSL